MERIHHKIKQNTDEWHDIRRGRFTSSIVSPLFSDPLTKRDKELGLLSKTAQKLVEEKALELLNFNKPIFEHDNFDWGHEYEPFAAMAYQEIKQVDIFDGDFWTYGENHGSSPDRLVGKVGLLEIKNPKNQSEHIYNLRNIKSELDLLSHRKEYYYQCQHQMYTTGREWCDFLSFDIRLFTDEKVSKAGFVCIRIEPNLEVFKEFDRRIQIASELRDKIMNEILEYNI